MVFWTGVAEIAGAIGLLAAWLQPRIVPEGDAARFLAFWLTVAAAGFALVDDVAMPLLRSGEGQSSVPAGTAASVSGMPSCAAFLSAMVSQPPQR